MAAMPIGQLSVVEFDMSLTVAAILSIVAIPAASVLYAKDAAKGLTLAFTVAAPASLLWGLIGYSMAYGIPISTGVIGDATFGTINKITPGAPGALGYQLGGATLWGFVYYSFMYALLALCLIAGGIGQHMKKNLFLFFTIATLLLNYLPLAMWFWNPLGWAYSYNILDFAGGLVVHTYAGFAVLTLGLLSRHKRSKVDYGTVQSLLAVFGLYVGKQALQCSGGSPGNALPNAQGLNSAGGWSSLAALNTIIAAYTGVAINYLMEHVLPFKGTVGHGEDTPSGAIKGAIQGVISVASGAAFMMPEYAVLSVVCSQVIVYVIDWATKGIDVAGFDMFITHGVSGAVGSAVIGLFVQAQASGNSRAQNGSFFWNAIQLGKQCAGISVVILLTVVATVCIYGLIYALAAPFKIAVWEEEDKAELELKAVAAPAGATATA